MRLYICADGSFAGTQADAKAKGRGWREEDVPTDKAGLLDYLNANVERTERLPAPPLVEAGPPPAPAATPATYAKRLLEEGRELDQIAEWIGELDHWRLAKLLNAVIERASELARQLKVGIKQ